MINSLWPSKGPSHASPADLAELPLHDKQTSKVCLLCRHAQMCQMEAMCGAVSTQSKQFDTGRPRENHLSGVNAKTPATITPRSGLFQAIIDDYLSYQQFENNEAPECADAELGPTDTAKLAASKIIKLWPGKDLQGKPLQPKANLRVFTTCEKEHPHRRRRLVTHTPHLNETYLIDSYSLPNTSHLLKKVKKYAYAYTIDFKFFFAQFTLPSSVLFLFRDQGSWWQLSIIPTGASNRPLIAQLFSESIAEVLKSYFPLAGSQGARIDVDVYIDNLRILANDLPTLRDALMKLYAICQHFKVDINEPLATVLASDPLVHCRPVY